MKKIQKLIKQANESQIQKDNQEKMQKQINDLQIQNQENAEPNSRTAKN